MQPSSSRATIPLRMFADETAREVTDREVDLLRAENRRVMERVNIRRRRGWMFMALLLLTLAVTITLALLELTSSHWFFSEQTQFTEMTTLLVLFTLATPLSGYLALRLERQRQRVREGRTRHREIMHRLAKLDGLPGEGLRRRRRRRSRRWFWNIVDPPSFTRPRLELLGTEELLEAASKLGASFIEGRHMRTVAYMHASIMGGLTLGIVTVLTLSGPAHLASFVGGHPWGETVGSDPLLDWLSLTVVTVLVGGVGLHHVSVLLRRARRHQERLAAIERALSDACVMARNGRKEVSQHLPHLGLVPYEARMSGCGIRATQDSDPNRSIRLSFGGGVANPSPFTISSARI